MAGGATADIGAGGAVPGVGSGYGVRGAGGSGDSGWHDRAGGVLPGIQPAGVPGWLAVGGAAELGHVLRGGGGAPGDHAATVAALYGGDRAAGRDGGADAAQAGSSGGGAAASALVGRAGADAGGDGLCGGADGASAGVGAAPLRAASAVPDLRDGAGRLHAPGRGGGCGGAAAARGDAWAVQLRDVLRCGGRTGDASGDRGG